jgi:hypothetical protein
MKAYTCTTANRLGITSQADEEAEAEKKLEVRHRKPLKKGKEEKAVDVMAQAEMIVASGHTRRSTDLKAWLPKNLEIEI